MQFLISKHKNIANSVFWVVVSVKPANFLKIFLSEHVSSFAFSNIKITVKS